MRLLRRSNNGEFSLTKYLVGDDAVPPYAILSHTWGADAEEVTFEDMTNGAGRNKPGYEKIRFCGEQAAQDNLEYFWIDTCCINKTNYAELSQSIKSMFRWYRNATRCYVYLSDVSGPSLNPNEELSLQPQNLEFWKSKWFTRGWTLQELLAPSLVEFFSRERKRLGDKGSLRRRIHEITGIPESALQGAPLSQFSVNERLSWIEYRQTKLGEDKAYSLLGIFSVYIPPLYGEGIEGAFKRLLDEISKLEKCFQDLRLTDPSDDKKRIEETKGGLLEESYYWILENSDFQQWRDNPQSRLLWIKGDPGKGKTMLLCGIVNELKKSMAKSDLLSYFFCQATDSRINNATAILRGLVYLLVDQQPSLTSHVRKKHDHAGKALFEDANAWIALSEIFIKILQDPSLNNTYLIIDALDECVVDLPKLLDFIAQRSSTFSRVKWVISSRNDANIEQRLRLDDSGKMLSLELKENAAQVSRAVNIYINHCLSELTEIQNNNLLRKLVQEKIQHKANGTFLWVSLIIRDLKEAMGWEILQVLDEVPVELKDVYRRMMGRIRELRRQRSDLCRQVLSTIVAAYRPLHLQELYLLSGSPIQVQNVIQFTTEIVRMCSSFLTIRNNNVYIIHQSAMDFLSEEASPYIFPYGIGDVHYSIFSKSLQVMSRTLRRDMYSLRGLGYLTRQVKQPNPDPLAESRYSCVYWVDHLCESNPNSHRIDLQDGGAIDSFVRKRYLYWLEALSLCKSMSEGVASMTKLEALVQKRVDPSASALIKLVQDARRFIIYHKGAIENCPLQVYVSALVFSPARSLIRVLFKEEEPEWIAIKPGIEDKWSACLQTLEGHSDSVSSVAFSPDSARLASGSEDTTVKVWDASSGECLQTLKGHSNWVFSVAFSPNSARLASGSKDNTAKIWDTSNNKCLQTLKGHSNWIRSVAFSPDSDRLASGSDDKTIKIWDTSSGECIQTLKGHSDWVRSVAFSPDLARLASGSKDKTVKIWDASSGECLQTLNGHSDWVMSIAFSPDLAWLASGSNDMTVKIWDTSSGECLQTLKGHSNWVLSVAFSPDSARLASGSDDKTVKIWDVSSGKCLQTLKGHNNLVGSVAFSPNPAWLASGSKDKTVKLWDASSSECLQALKGHSNWVFSVAFSPDSARLASGSDDSTVKIWDASSGECLQTLKGHSDSVLSVAFSPDSSRLASGSDDKTVKIWDASSGKCLQTLKGHSNLVGSVAFSPNSARLASGSKDNTVKIWDASSGECLQTLKGHSNWVSSVAFSPDLARLASGSDDSTVKIWDASSGECIQTLKGHSDWVSSVAFSPDLARLASGSNDKTVKIWDASNGECLQTLSIGKALINISFDATGSYLQTEIGTIVVDFDPSLASNMTPNNREPQNPQYQGRALSLDEAWIIYGSENLVWLPSEYRPSCWAVSEKTIGIGVGSGKVWLCKIELNAFI